MGSYASLPALRIAQGFASAPDSLRPLTLFADGFIAYSVGDASVRGGAPAIELLALAEDIIPDSGEAMQWICSDWGMQMSLACDVPERLAAVLGPLDCAADVRRRVGSCRKEAEHFGAPITESSCNRPT